MTGTIQYNTGYAVVSSVRLLRIDRRSTPRLTESPFVTLFMGPVNSLPRRLSIVLRTRTIKFKGIIFQGGSFRAVHGGYVCTRGIVPHVQIDPAGSILIRYIERGIKLYGGIGYFVTPAL